MKLQTLLKFDNFDRFEKFVLIMEYSQCWALCNSAFHKICFGC